MNKEKAKLALKHLIEYTYYKYKDKSDFKSNENQIRASLIEPFVNDVLGWSIKDPSEFQVESRIKGKRSDIAICLEGRTQFIIEVKSMMHNLVDNYDFYKQAMSYAYGKGNKLAILTNFKQFIVLRCEKEIEPWKAVIRSIFIETYTDEDFDLLYNFSKQIWIETGKENPIYAKFAHLKDRRDIDLRLLDNLKKWREEIINNIQTHSRHNKYDFSKEEEKNYVEQEIQRFLDRLIFICYTEDKEFVDPELRSLAERKNDDYKFTQNWLLEKLRNLFKKYWNDYNSDLFKPGDCDKFYIDDIVLLKIINDLRNPRDDLPYDFASIEADILGKTYENYIGHVIAGKKRLREKESKGKRKSEGIYYTPTYIVDYIVRNTVKEYIKGKSLGSIYKIKILDPACGSGSFLIKAFDILVDEAKRIKGVKELSYEDKEALMLNCIHGVDKDERAVDICKLNLSLKLAERRERLPELHNNIKCGDSLIDDKEIAGYKAFKWEEEFKEIMSNGGFDVVIGNPPYIDSEEMVKTQPETRQYCSLHYKTAKGNWDIYIPFYELAHNLLKEGGVTSFITPNKWVSIDYGKELRKKFNNYLIRICNCDEIKVFKDAGNSPIITFIKKGKNTNEIKIDYFNKNQEINNSDSIPSKFLSDSNWGILLSKNPKLLLKLQKINTFIGDFCKVENPFTVSEAYKLINFLFDGKNDKQDGLKLINTGTIDRYISLWGVENTAYIKKKYKYPFIKKNLFKNSMPKRYEQSISSKIIISGIRHFENFLDKKGEYVAGKSTLLIRKINEKLSLEFLSALLNSKLVTYYIKESYSATGIGGGTNFTSKMVAELPAPNKIEKGQEKGIVSLVDKMLSLNKKLQEIGDKNTLEKQKLEEEIKKTDNEIDEIVYQLYGITEEEKKIIEESLK